MKKVVAALLFSVFLAHILFMWLSAGATKFYNQTTQQLNECINGDTYHNYLFAGSSRTQMHINPRIIDSITGGSSFNLGRAGANLDEVQMLLLAYLKNHKAPAFLFLNLDGRTISTGPISNARIYLNYLNNLEIENGLKGTYKNVGVLKWIPFSRMVHYDDYYRIVSIQGHNNKTEEVAGSVYYKGYTSAVTQPEEKINSNLKINDTVNFIQLGQGMALRLKNDTEVTGEFVDKIINEQRDTAFCFLRLIALCKQYKIQPVFFIAPGNVEGSCAYSDTLFIIPKTLAQANNIPFVRFDNLNLFTKNDFIDEAHLDLRGSTRFSGYIGNFIKGLEQDSK